MYKSDAAEVDAAKALLESRGFTVLRTKSYRAAQERLRVAVALQEAAEERRRDTEVWVREKLIPEERRLHARLSEVYGAARAAGVSVEALSGLSPFAKGGLVESPEGADLTVPVRYPAPCVNGHALVSVAGAVQHVIPAGTVKSEFESIMRCERSAKF